MTEDSAPPVPERRKPPEPDYEEEKRRRDLMPLRFTDNGENYVVKDFFSLYCGSLPQVVVVSQGQYGEIDLDTFCGGQVMYIHSYGSQTRVIARDTRGRTFSIPADYPIKFKVVLSRTKDGPEQTLQEILDHYQLPVQAKFALPPSATFYIGCDQQKAGDLSNLALAESYQETYMLANCINTKHLDEKTILVPAYLQDALLSTVTGIEDKPQEEWHQYLLQLQQEMKDITVDIMIGNKDIAFFDDDSLDIENNVYDYIEPKNFLTMSVALGDDEGSIYAPVDEDQVREPTPPLPERKKSNETKTPKVPSREKIVKDEKPKKDDSSSHGYVNDIPRAPVGPIRSLFKKASDKDKNKDKDKESNTEEPWTVKTLTIDELGKKMKKLGLEKHVQGFKKQQVDGSIALELTNEILKSDFGFTGIEAIKMTKFINSGHIPK